MYDFRTDLVDERRDIFKKANKIENEIEGLETEEEEISDKLKVTRVKITNERSRTSNRQKNRKLYYNRYKENEYNYRRGNR